MNISASLAYADVAAAAAAGIRPVGHPHTQEESDDDDEGVQYGPAPLYRRMGLPANVLVEREGDRYILSRNAGNEAIEAVLWFRRQALAYHGLPRTAILPYHVHSDALWRFKKWFEYSNLARRAWLKAISMVVKPSRSAGRPLAAAQGCCRPLASSP